MSNYSPDPRLIEQLIATGQIAAIGMGGSRASGVSDDNSDFDIYAFTTGPVPLTARSRIADGLSDGDPIEIGNSWWGDEDGYAIDGTWYEIAYFDTDWFFDGIDAVVNQHRASTGYSTSFVYTLTNLRPLYDPDGLIAKWQAKTETYPPELAKAIIELNLPIVADVHASYRNQIARAVQLNDAVSVNHRVAGFLASVFEIAFASLRLWHPGEKRQLQHLRKYADRLPVDFEDHILTALHHTTPHRFAGLVDSIDVVAKDVRVIARNATRLDSKK